MSNTNMVPGSWRRDEWPEYITVSHDGMREPGRRYVPERTCRDTDYDTESVTCSECGEITLNTLFYVDVDGGEMVKAHRPNFCSNRGARVVG